jgi:hypothetical protein
MQSIDKHFYLSYVLNFTKSPRQPTGTIPNKGIKQVKSDQFSKTLASYNWSHKVMIFGKVKEKS